MTAARASSTRRSSRRIRPTSRRAKVCSAFSNRRAISARSSRCSRNEPRCCAAKSAGRRWQGSPRSSRISSTIFRKPRDVTRRFWTRTIRTPSALKGLDRVYNRTGRYHDLLGVLERQIRAAVTPRQRITLYERLAAIYDEEFIDHEKAAEACEAILAIDPNVEEPLSALARHYRALDRWEDVASAYERQIKAVTDDKRKRGALARARKGAARADRLAGPRAQRLRKGAVDRPEPDRRARRARQAARRIRRRHAAPCRPSSRSPQQATTPEAKAEQWLRAGKLLEEAGDLDGAIERYKSALNAVPAHPAAIDALRGAYTARGDASAALELIARQIEMAEGPPPEGAPLGGDRPASPRPSSRTTRAPRPPRSRPIDSIRPTSTRWWCSAIWPSRRSASSRRRITTSCRPTAPTSSNAPTPPGCSCATSTPSTRRARPRRRSRRWTRCSRSPRTTPRRSRAWRASRSTTATRSARTSSTASCSVGSGTGSPRAKRRARSIVSANRPGGRGSSSSHFLRSPRPPISIRPRRSRSPRSPSSTRSQATGRTSSR